MINVKKITGQIAIVLVFVASASFAFASSPPPKKYTPVSRPHSWKEELTDVSAMYFALWIGYAATQPDAFPDMSVDLTAHNIFDVGAQIWDKGSWLVNFVGHPYVGSEYYLYFRSRGYAPQWAFVGSFATSTLFEEFVETTSTPFSFNDFVVTPIIGGLIGYGREKASIRLLHTDNKFYRAVGHVLWLETNFWFFEDFEITPAVSPDGQAGGIGFMATF